MIKSPHLLSFDVEEHWRSYESRGLSTDLPHNHDLIVLDRILSLLAGQGKRATFFVLAAFAEKEPGLVRKIIEAGQEVASHGYSHRTLAEHTPESFCADSARAKGILEDLSGHAVVGFRAPQWSLTKATAWALPILADLGHVYDSSAFPGRIHRHGWPSMPSQPHRILFADGRSLVEFPAARLGLGSWAVQMCGGFHWRALPGPLHMLAARRNPAWYFHCYDLDAGYPLPAGLPLKVRWFKKVGTVSAFARLQRLVADFPVGTHADAVVGVI